MKAFVKVAIVHYWLVGMRGGERVVEVLSDLYPEADGEEGLFDMRILAAIERSLDTGETVTLEPASRSRRVEPDQALKLKPAKEPGEDEMISIIPQSA